MVLSDAALSAFLEVEMRNRLRECVLWFGSIGVLEEIAQLESSPAYRAFVRVAVKQIRRTESELEMVSDL